MSGGPRPALHGQTWGLVMSTTTEPQPTRLVRELGLLDAAMIVIGSMIGSGIFITSAESARLVSSPGWLLVAWVLAGFLTVSGALCCAELSAAMPRAGGQYVFLREAFGAPVGFLFGWALFLVVQTGTIAAVAVAFAKFLGVVVPSVSDSRFLVEPIRIGTSGYAISLSTQQLAAVAVIALLTVLNTRGLRTGKTIQNTLTITKTAALGALIVLGLSLGLNRESAAFQSSWWDAAANGWTAEATLPGLKVAGTLAFLLVLGKAMIGPLFSQTAWNNVTFTGGEVRDPGRTLPRALVLGCATVVMLYVLANLAYVVTLPLAGIQNAPQDRVGTATMEAILGPAGLYAMAVAIMISTFGCDNGLILAGSRVLYAMAQNGLFFARAGRLNAQHVPAFALAIQGVWAAFLTLPRTVTTARDGATTFGNVYSQLLEYVVAADLLFYMLMVGAVMWMRVRRPDLERPYRTPGYPVTPIAYLLLAGLLMLALLIVAPETCGVGFAIVLTGLPVYGLWRVFGRQGQSTAEVKPAP